MGFLNPNDAHFWIAAALVVFLVILWRAKVPALLATTLDAAGAKVQAQLDEAARLRAEAAALLAQIKARHEETEAAATELMRSAKLDAELLLADAKVQLDEDLRRRRALAERRIATAEARAAAEVKAHAADLAADLAESILAARLAAAKTDSLIDVGLASLGDKLR